MEEYKKIFNVVKYFFIKNKGKNYIEWYLNAKMKLHQKTFPPSQVDISHASFCKQDSCSSNLNIYSNWFIHHWKIKSIAAQIISLH